MFFGEGGGAARGFPGSTTARSFPGSTVASSFTGSIPGRTLLGAARARFLGVYRQVSLVVLQLGVSCEYKNGFPWECYS